MWGTRRRLPGRGVTLAVSDEGAGPLVLLLHGFPDTAAVWRRQVPALVAAGLRAIGPDLRGRGDSDRPDEVADYGLGRSVADLVALLDALEIERARVVGHDWGAGLAWVFAAVHPERVERLVAISVGHPNATRVRTIEDREKAWYMLLFQFPGVAEAMIQRDDWRLLREFLDGFGDEERYVADLARPGALTAALNWYRANAAPERELEPRRPLPAVRAPTLGIWGSRDRYLREQPMVASREHVTGEWRYVRLEAASHWPQLDATDALNALLVDFLR